MMLLVSSLSNDETKVEHLYDALHDTQARPANDFSSLTGFKTWFALS